MTTDLTDREALVAVLQDKRNRYLVRQLCWLLIARGLETYLLKPYDPADYDELVRAYAADPKGFVVVVGYRGGTANPQDCKHYLRKPRPLGPSKLNDSVNRDVASSEIPETLAG